MARAKKSSEFTGVLSNLNDVQLKTLISEAQVALEIFEKENSLSRKKDKAILLRDKLTIGSTAWAKIRKEVFTGKVMAITAENVKILGANGNSKNFKIMQLIDADEVKQLIAEDAVTLAEIKSKKDKEENGSGE